MNKIFNIGSILCALGGLLFIPGLILLRMASPDFIPLDHEESFAEIVAGIIAGIGLLCLAIGFILIIIYLISALIREIFGK